MHAKQVPAGRADSSTVSAPLTLRVVSDERGVLVVAETGNPIPFTPVRFFTISKVPARVGRGGHAHKECHQFLVCVAGSCDVTVDDGHHSVRHTLSDPGAGLHLPPMTWCDLQNFSADAVLLVLASHLYDDSDYVRNRDEFQRLAGLMAER